MFIHELFNLVKSLSGNEKRLFKLFAKKQGGGKMYMDLYNIISNTGLEDDVKEIQYSFQKKYPKKNFDNTANYLLRQITDSLLNTRKENDKWFQQYHAIMRSKILQERSLMRAGYKEIKKAQKLSIELQDNLVFYYTCKLDLNYWSDLGFPDHAESDIVQMHMKAKSALRLLNKIQDQSSLFDTLKYRTIHFGKSLSNSDNAKMNDLLISELSLITRDFQENFESKKLHLLFQSFFFIQVNDYKSSLKSFNELNELFESNESVWSFPPYDYLSTLDGILDSLRTIGRYENMNYYISKIETLARGHYPENFQNVAWQNVYIYRLAVSIGQNDLKQARITVDEIPPHLLKNALFIGYEKYAELLFNVGLIAFLEKGFKKAIKHFNLITSIGNVIHSHSIYKAARLMHILVHYELKNLSYLDYEIRSYKRGNNKKGKLLKMEKLVLSVIHYNPKAKSKQKNKILWDKLQPKKDEIEQNKYERQLLKYYDFIQWIKEKLANT